MKKTLILGIILTSQFAHSEDISLVCSLVETGETEVSHSVVTFDTESKELKRVDGDETKTFSISGEPEATYEWKYSYKFKDYDVDEYYTLNRTTMFISHTQSFAGRFTTKQGQCFRQNPKI